MRTINRHRIKLLALPFMTLAVIVMFFSFSQSSNQAEAASQGATAMELRAPSSAEVGSKFTVSVYGNLTPAVPIAGFAARIFTSAGIKYNGSKDCLAEVKVRPADGGLALCSSFNPPLGPFGNAWTVLTDLSVPVDALLVGASAKVELMNVSYTCNTAGTQTIILTSASGDPDGAQYGGTDLNAIPVKDVDGVADEISIDCEPPALGGLVMDLAGDETGLPLETAESSGTSAGLLVGVIAAISAVAITVTGAAWYARRRLIS